VNVERLIIFDVDGVLEDDEKIAEARRTAQYTAIAQRFSITLEEAKSRYKAAKEELRPEQKHTSAYIFTSFGFTREEFFAVLDSVEVKGLVEPSPGAQETLEKLCEESRIVVFSNTPRHALQRTLEEIGVERYIHRAYTSEEFSESKPSPRSLNRILTTEGYSPEQSYYVGDSVPKDMAPAKEAGMTTILYDPRGEQARHGKPKTVDFVVRALREIERIVSR
jgi:putative hydrolase of the HAD superfamily